MQKTFLEARSNAIAILINTPNLKDEVLPANWPAVGAYWNTLCSSMRDPPIHSRNRLRLLPHWDDTGVVAALIGDGWLGPPPF